MGYTHYWRNSPIQPNTWDVLVADAKRIVAEAGVPLSGPVGYGEPILTSHEISLNGKPEDDYESFMLFPGGTGFEFCKTGMRPYDLVVGCILLRAALTVPGFRLKSDGTWDEWQDIRELYGRLFEPAPDESPFRSV